MKAKSALFAPWVTERKSWLRGRSRRAADRPVPVSDADAPVVDAALAVTVADSPAAVEGVEKVTANVQVAPGPSAPRAGALLRR